MRIIDGFAGMRSAFPNGAFSLEAWRSYARTISNTLPEKVEADTAEYDFQRDVLPVLELLYKSPEKAAQAHESFLKVTQGLPERLEAVLGSPVDAVLVFYLGLCCAAGWATELDGRPAVLLGVEKIVELDWGSERDMVGLVYHELGHLWHFQTRSAPVWDETPREKALWQLYTEGVAMYAEQLLCENPHFYHQDRDGWLTWCRENRTRLFAEYRRRADAGENVQDFFGDWCAFEGYSDVGYYLGAELIHALAAENTLQELADLGLPAAERALAALAGGKA